MGSVNKKINKISSKNKINGQSEKKVWKKMVTMISADFNMRRD